MTDALVSIIDTALVSVDESCEKLLLGSIIRLKRARFVVLKKPLIVRLGGDCNTWIQDNSIKCF